MEEKLHRFEIFKENLKHIDQRNKEITSYWLGLNEFADMSHEEFKSKYLGLKSELPRRRESSKDFSYGDVVDLPKSVDWRKKGAVTPVKNQGSCGMYIYISLSPSLRAYITVKQPNDVTVKVSYWISSKCWFLLSCYPVV